MSCLRLQLKCFVYGFNRASMPLVFFVLCNYVNITPGNT